jgi:hypothetical protein
MRREGTPTGSPERKLSAFHQKAQGQAKVCGTFVVILLLVCNATCSKSNTYSEIKEYFGTVFI